MVEKPENFVLKALLFAYLWQLLNYLRNKEEYEYTQDKDLG